MSTVNVVEHGKKVQNSVITDETIDKVNKLIGVWLRRDIHYPSMAEPLSLQDIRRWAIYSVGDDNPLWRDVEYAQADDLRPATSRRRPSSTRSTAASSAPGLAGVQWIFAGGTWELYKPVKVGRRAHRARAADPRRGQGRQARAALRQPGRRGALLQPERRAGRPLREQHLPHPARRAPALASSSTPASGRPTSPTATPTRRSRRSPRTIATSSRAAASRATGRTSRSATRCPSC